MESEVSLPFSQKTATGKIVKGNKWYGENKYKIPVQGMHSKLLSCRNNIRWENFVTR